MPRIVRNSKLDTWVASLLPPDDQSAAVLSPTGKSPKACLALRAKTFRLTRRANQVSIGSLLIFQEAPIMTDRSSELIEISKLNGDFKRNYGKLIGAFLYLRSISAARGRSLAWTGLLVTIGTIVLAWLKQRGLPWS